MNPGRVLAAGLLCAGLGFVLPANGTTTGSFECVFTDNLFIEDGIDTASYTECETGAPQHNDSVTQVNADMMFGFGDWTDIGRVDFGDDADGSDGALTVTDTGATALFSGTWSILESATWDLYSEIMLVLKDGNSAIPNSYIGYLLLTGDLLGDWQSPYTNADGTTQKNASHFNIYGRGIPEIPEIPEIPLPAALPIFLLTLAGAALFARRRPA